MPDVAAADARFTGSVPEMYDRHLGPMLFAPYAADLAARLHLPPAAAVLEVAAGTGILTERLLATLPGGASLTVTDLNAPMLELARRKLAGDVGGRDVAWRTADALDLPFADGAFDAVVCQFGAMFFPDKPRATREAFRVLRPGGAWLFSVWGALADNPHGSVTYEVGARFFPASPPEFYRVPFNLHDPDALRRLVTGAGFEEPEIATLDRTVESPSALEAAVGLVRGNPLIDTIRERGTVAPEVIERALADELARGYGDHPLRLPTRVLVVSTRRPG